jgi:L-proline amide hydrolase
MSSPNTPPSYPGEAPFVYPAAKKPLKTWYKVVGDLESGIRPLVIIHGGPGLTHDLLLSHTDLATQYSIPVIFYDQIGSGRSTHLPETASIPDFWTEKIFVSQLKQLLVHLKIDDNWAMLGSSWGGMLGSHFAALRHKGLKKVILANSTASKALSTANLNLYKEKMPKEMRDILAKHEKEGTTSDPEYIATSAAFNAAFTKKHVCNIDPLPEDLLASLKWSKEDRTVVNAM